MALKLEKIIPRQITLKRDFEFEKFEKGLL